MTVFFNLIFAATLFYFSRTERFRTYVKLLAIQGGLLFFISIFELVDYKNYATLGFILTETIVFKAVIIPMLLTHVIKKTKINRVHDSAMPAFGTSLLVTLAFLVSLALAYWFKSEGFSQVYFTNAVFTLFTGLLLIVTHKKIFSHLVGFLVIENGVFLLSLAVGGEMPMMVNTGVLLDIIVSILILSAFTLRIGNEMNDLDIEKLNTLKD